MSHESPDDGDDEEKPALHGAGYKRPPVEHRFKKGQSGNPRGRPRKVKPSGRREDAQFATQLADALWLEEAYRLVTVRDGDRTEKIPVVQAIMRSQAVLAMRGNRMAQKTFIDQVRQVEAIDRKERLENFAAAADYKNYWEMQFERARELRLPTPKPIPHPDDVILDLQTGASNVCGPITRQEKESWDWVLAHRDQIQAEVSRLAEAHRRARTPRTKTLTLECWRREQERYDLVNQNFPPRYRRELEDRCWADGE